MAKRKVHIDVQIEGRKTVQGLQEEMKRLNDELRQVEIGSEEFSRLEHELVGVKSQLKDVRNDLRPITGDEQLRAFKALGDAMQGAFQIGGAAALAFGEQTAEQMQRVIRTVGAVVVAMDGVKKVLEVVQGENLRVLRSMINRWREAGRSATIAGVSMRTAVIGTGIGALVVALGLVVANWERINSAITDRRVQRQRQRYLDWLEEEIEHQQAIFNELEEQFRLRQEANLLNDDEEATLEYKNELLEREGDLIENNVKKLVTERMVVEQDLNKEIQRQADAQQAVERASEATVIQRRNELARINENVQELERQSDLINEQLRTEQERERLRLRTIRETQEEIRLFQERERIDKQNEAIQNRITLLQAQGRQTTEIFRLERQILRNEREKLNLNRALTREQRQRIAQINAEIQALEITSYEFIRQLEFTERLTEIERAREDVMHDINRQNEELSRSMIQQQGTLNRRVELERAAAEMMRLTKDGYADFIDDVGDLLKLQTDITAASRLNAEYVQLIPSSIAISRDNYREIARQLQFINREHDIGIKDMSELGELVEGNVEFYKQQLNVTSSLHDELLNEFALRDAMQELQTRLSNAVIDELQIRRNNIQAQKDLNVQKQEALKLSEEDLKEIRDGLQEELYAMQARNAGLEEISEKQNEIHGVVSSIRSIESEIQTILTDNVGLKEEIKDIDFEISQNMEWQSRSLMEQAIVNRDMRAAVEHQRNVWVQIIRLVEVFGEELRTMTDGLWQSMELTATMFDREAEKRRRELEDWKQANLEALNEIDERERANASRRQELNDLLANAEGERYNMIKQELAEIQKQEEKDEERKKEIKNTEMEMEHEIALAEFRAAQARRTQTLVDITMQTALAAVQALPNIVLAGLVTGLGGLQFATAAATPSPQRPQEPNYFAGGGGIHGDKHARASGGVPIIAQDGEYVVNHEAMKIYGALVDRINNTAQPKYAMGGGIGKPQDVEGGDLIDYDRMRDSFVEAMRGVNLSVSVQEFKEVEGNIDFVRNRVSFR